MKKISKAVLLSLLAIGLALIFLINGFTPTDVSAQSTEPELILFLAASSSTPFQDLSSLRHTVVKVQSISGTEVQLIYDSELGRDVYSFANGGHLEVLDILDIYEFLKLTSEDEMTIEINVKITDQDPVYYCEEQQLPITQPIPDQMIFSKGPIDNYPRNYALPFTWGRDDLRPECGYGTVGYFPGVSFGIGGMTHGFHSPFDTSEMVGWRVYSFLISRSSDNPKEVMVWCYTNRNDNPYPANFPVDELDSQSNTFPLVIGNGFATGGTLEFQPNPFYGYIDYIRIYKGLLLVEELNHDPYGPIPGLPSQVIEAVIDIDPDTLNLKSKGKWVTAYTKLPEGYDVNDIDIATVKLQYNESSVDADWGDVQGDVLMIKFDRDSICILLYGEKGNVELKVTGEVAGAAFEGSDIVKIISKGKK